MPNLKNALITFALACCFAVTSLAQASDAGIVVTVKDQLGSIIRDAEIVLRRSDDEEKRLKTNSQGMAQFFHLRGGDYTFVGRNSGITGIYRRGGSVDMPITLQMHEATHLAYQVGDNLEVSLAALLGVKYHVGKTKKDTGKNAGDALSSYFNSGCYMTNRNRR